jgi:ATP-dependent Clp protease ATP-binding subunit ClpA
MSNDQSPIDPTRICPKPVRFDREALAQAIKRKMVGHDREADQIASLLELRLQHPKPGKPLGVFLLAGPRGSGKTLFSKLLAENLHEGKGRLVHVEMDQMRHVSDKCRLTGIPLGYTGGAGTLTTALEQNPRSVVLLDNYGHAHPDVETIFIKAWSDGFLTDLRTSRRVSIREALFLLSTHAAWEQMLEIKQTLKEDPAARKQAIERALQPEGFPPETWVHIDHTFIFAPLDPDGMARLATLKIEHLATQYGLVAARIDPDYPLRLISDGGAFHGGSVGDLSWFLSRQLGGQLGEAQQKGARSVGIAFVEGKPLVQVLEEGPTKDAGQS